MPVPMAGRMTSSKLICYFFSYPVAFGFWSSPADNITINPANRKMDQSLSDFQTGICVAAHATLDTEQLISHIRTALVDTTASAKDSDLRVILVQEVLEL